MKTAPNMRKRDALLWYRYVASFRNSLKDNWCRRSRPIPHFYPRTISEDGDAERDDRVNPTSKSVLYIWRAAAALSRRLEAR